MEGTRLPRSVSLGLGLPLVRPARTALTLAAVVLGVMTVTFASGLVASVTRYAEVADRTRAVQVYAHPASPEAAAQMGRIERVDIVGDEARRARIAGADQVHAQIALEAVHEGAGWRRVRDIAG